MRRSLISRVIPLAALAAVGPGLPSCNDGAGVMLAKQIENRGELVGGPVAMADVGDYLLQNDQIKVAILGPKDSPGPGVFGGSIVDVDLRRDRLGFENAQGHDRFAELFPVTNLLVPFPGGKPDANGAVKTTDVRVLKDGADGEEASIRVEGVGDFLFEALRILQTDAPQLKLIGFPDVKTHFRFRTDYILRRGERHVIIRTTAIRDEMPDGCDDVSHCTQCEAGVANDPATGCPSTDCACEAPLSLDTYSESASVFGQIFGDQATAADRKIRAGVVAGDFVFFGNQNSVFAPGAGFDVDTAVHDAFYAGRNTFQQPLSFDFVTASGGDVSYGYFTVSNTGKAPLVNVPILTGAATAFLAASKNCTWDDAAGGACDGKRAWVYERYLAVGDGDVASVADEVWKTRKTPTGKLQGVVVSATGEPSPKAHVYVFKNPHPGLGYADIDAVAEANLRADGSPGLVDEVDADVGLDLVRDGDFHATLPAGSYVIVARTEDGMGYSAPHAIDVVAGQTIVVTPQVATPGTVEYRVVDDTGDAVPAKIALVGLTTVGGKTVELNGDGKRRVYLGDGRLGNGIRALDHAIDGRGSMRVEPGTYRFRASRGPEYGVYEQDIVVESGRVARVDGLIKHEVDTTGWISTDTHLHATPSFDSGMELHRRLATIVDEHVEMPIATDHDVHTDYGPTVRAMLLDPYVKPVVGVETTTIEQGHFIGFPLQYDASIHPTHGSHDPTCESGGEIVTSLRKRGDGIDPFVILAHPRDGFFGYMYQLGVDPFTMTRKTGSLEANNPVFRTATCEFDGMELINGKRFDLVRTATVAEVIDYNRCRTRLDAAQTEAELQKSCPEIAAIGALTCAAGERFPVCRDRARSRLAWESMKRILTRTPAEQETYWNYSKSQSTGATDCAVKTWKDAPVSSDVADEPCVVYSGHVEDYFRYLEHGMVKTQIAGSDGHETVHEPGYPRTYLRSATDSPSAISVPDAVATLKNGNALTTYGPFVTASVEGKTFGETATVKGGGKVKIDLKVQTASWFGVDRIEIYRNGLLAKEIDVDVPVTETVDFDKQVEIDVPADRDSWIVIIAMGLKDENLMHKVSLDIPYGEIQISKVTADAFALIPGISSLFEQVATLPDWFPIPAYAVSNAILIDANGNGTYDAPLGKPEFCSIQCDQTTVCPGDQFCLTPENMCGYQQGKSTCDHRIPWSGGGLTEAH